MSISPCVIEQIRSDIANAPYGMATYHARTWATLLGRSVQNIFTIIKRDSNRERKGSPLKPEYQEWTRIVFAIKKSPPDGAGEISTDQAVKIGVQWGKLPEAALDVPDATYNLIARKAGLDKKLRRVSRFQADRPNRLHHFDASSSKFLYIAKKLGDNDFLLKIHRPGSGDYKNKPIPVDRLRPWYYGIVDDHSGRLWGTIVPAAGENSDHSLQAICGAWSEMGVPDELLADQGCLKRGLISKDLIARLGVRLPESMPYAKEAHGKIERTHRTAWQRFEKPFYVGDWKKWELPLSELVEQYQNYLADDYNQMSHRFETDITKMQAWSRVNLYGGIVQIPGNALLTAARRADRIVGQDGMLQVDGKPYEVKHLHSAAVTVFLGVYDDRIIVQDKKDGKKYEVKEFTPLNIGEYKAHTDTPHQKLIKEYAPQLTGAAPMIYATAKPADEKIISMPIRTKEEREIADPFDIHHYATLADAMKEFNEIVGTFISQEEREGIEAAIMENGLNKQYVTDLALEVSGALEVERQSAVG